MKFCQKCGRQVPDKTPKCICGFEFEKERVQIVEKIVPKFTHTETVLAGIFGGFVLIAGIALGIFLVHQVQQPSSSNTENAPSISKNVETDFLLKKYEENFKEIQTLADTQKFDEAYQKITDLNDIAKSDSDMTAVQDKVFELQKYVAQKEALKKAEETLAEEHAKAEALKKEQEAKDKMKPFANFIGGYTFRYSHDGQNQQSLSIADTGAVTQTGDEKSSTKVLKGTATFSKMKTTIESKTYSLNQPVRVVKAFVSLQCSIVFDNGETKTLYAYMNGENKPCLTDGKLSGKYLNEVWSGK